MVVEEVVVLSVPFDVAFAGSEEAFAHALRRVDRDRRAGDDGGVLREAMDPGVMTTLAGNEAIRPVADEARPLVGNAVGHLAGGS